LTEGNCVDLRQVNNWQYPAANLELSPNSHRIEWTTWRYGNEEQWMNCCQPLYFSSIITQELSDLWSLKIDSTVVTYDEFQKSYRRMLERWLNGSPTMNWHQAMDMISKALKWTESR